MKKILIVIGFCISLTSCTDNVRTKMWGGTSTIVLPTGEKLINITWKDNQAWYLTKKMKVDDVAENYTFSEKSSWGILEGKMLIIETK